MASLLMEHAVAIGLGLFSFIIASYQSWKAARFIGRAQGIRPVSAWGKLLSVYYTVPSLAAPVPMVGGTRLNAARYAIELDILLPAGDPGSTPSRKKEILRANLKTARQGKWAWLQEKFGLSSQPKTAAPIEVTDFPALDDSRQAIATYFQVLAAEGIEAEPRFLTPVTIKAGYIAPLFLVTGLLNRFSQKEGWALIMDNYRKLLAPDSGKCSPELLELKSFLFNCWLLWGPSITHCCCEMWRPKDSAKPEADRPILLQYGYGDENNAIDILMSPKPDQDLVEDISEQLTAGDKERLAVPYRVTGVFSWGPHLKGDVLPPAQALIRGTEDGESEANALLRSSRSASERDWENKDRDTAEGRVILNCSDHYKIPDEKSSKYYTAYIWIMFILLNEDGTPLFGGELQRWKNLLVFFEHANIASGAALDTLKRNLTVKTCSTLQEILTRDTDGHVRIGYICSVDDPFCSEGGTVFGDPGRGTNLVRMLSDYARSTPGMEVLKGHIEAGDRLILPLPHEKNLGAPAGYSSCHIPGIVDDFYFDLKTMAAE